MSTPIKPRASGHGSPSASRSFGTSYRSQHEGYIAAIAEESIARDLADEDGEDTGFDDNTDNNNSISNPNVYTGEEGTDNGGPLTTVATTSSLDAAIPPLGQHSMAGKYRRPSYIAGAPRPFMGTQLPEAVVPLAQDWEAAISEERSLLRDNHLIPPKHPRQRRRSSQASSPAGAGAAGKALRRILSFPASLSGRRKSAGVARPEDEEAGRGGGAAEDGDEEQQPTETTGLLSGAGSSGGRAAAAAEAGNGTLAADPKAAATSLLLPYGGENTPENISRKWEQAVEAGQIQTSWQRETKVLAKYSMPLMLTFVLQNSLTLTSIFTVGHIGKIELGAVSLGGMTANITGYAVYHGLATSLDTLCAQAYGSGRKQLVGLQLQRMVFFLWAITIPIAVVWAAGTQILAAIVPEQETAVLAGQYLRVLIVGAPGYACFESGKRYVQAQGRFNATMYVLLVAAPLNVLLHWLFVWRFRWGFIGCPIAVVITETLMPLLLLAYVRFVGGMECWPGFTTKAFRNWGPMIRLALPGLIMVLAEFLAFEVLTFAAARISATHLAANSVLQSVSVLTYQIPFPLSIAASTRVANLIGASLPDAAKTTTKVTFTMGFIIGIFNVIFLGALRFQIPKLFTNDTDVLKLAAATLPVNAAFQLFDALAAVCNGLLRGLGKQEFGGYINLLAYYVIALPVSFGLGFGLHLDLYGLWAGPVFGLAIVAGLEGIYIFRTSYEKASEEAQKRNESG